MSDKRKFWLLSGLLALSLALAWFVSSEYGRLVSDLLQ